MEAELNFLDESLFFNTSSFKQSIRANQGSIVLYGAGSLGKQILASLNGLKIKPIAFFDDTIGDEIGFVDDIPIYTPQAGLEKLGDKIMVIVCICNAKHRYTNTKKRFSSIGFKTVHSFADLIKAFPDVFGAYYVFDSNEVLLKHKEEINSAYSALEDKASKDTFISHLNFRLSNNFDYLPLPEKNIYLPTVIQNKISIDTHFIDCGAFVGDTLNLFENHYAVRFNKITAFEPDHKNFIRLTETIKKQQSYIGRDIAIYNYAIGGIRGEMLFSQTGTEGSAISTSGEIKVQVRPLEDYVCDSNTYIKFDIEGTEVDAIMGANNCLKKYKPIMAVSAYHKPSDLWIIPLLLKEIYPNYRLSLFTEGEDGMGLIYYAY